MQTDTNTLRIAGFSRIALLKVIQHLAVTSLVTFNAAAQAPIVASFSPPSGPIGATVTIAGANFSNTPGNNLVYFGASQTTVIAATTTELTVSVPPGATHEPISVNVGGLVAHSARDFVVVPPLAILNTCSFGPKVDYTIGFGSSSIAAITADFDGDGKPDFASSDRSNAIVSIFRNISSLGTVDGTSFAPAITKATSIDPYTMVAEDMDGDGRKDLIVVNAQSNSVSVFRNISTSGSIAFDDLVDYPVGLNPVGCQAKDLDADGKAEIIAVNRFSSSVSILKNLSSTGGFTPGSFASHIEFLVGTEPYAVSVSDLNSDSKPELIVANSLNNSVSILENTATAGSINASSFGPPVDFSVGLSPVGLALGDLDRDGKTDLIVGTQSEVTVSILKNNVVGAITPGSFTRQDFASDPNPAGIAVADLDGDGQVEVLASSITTNKLSILKNTSLPGTISLSLTTSIPTGLFPAFSNITDIDGDGRSEILVVTLNQGTLNLYQNLTGISLPIISSFSPNSGPVGSAVVITGTNLSTPFSNTVAINGVTAPITASSSTSLTITIPVGASTGPFEVTIGCNTVTSATSFCVPPGAPTPIPGSRCGPGTVLLSASGATAAQEYRWYDVATGGTSLASLASFSTPTLTASTTYHVSIFETGCESARTAVTATINSIPPNPTTTGANRCDAGTLTLTAIGGSPGQYRWYTGPTGGAADALQLNASFITPLLSTNTTFYVSINDGTCEGNRAPVTATISNLGAPAVSTSACTASSAVLAGPNGFSSYLWSNGATTPSITVTTAGSYSLTVTDAFGCTSPSSTPVVFTASFCNQPPTLLATTANTTVNVPVTISVVTLITDPDNNVDLTTLIVIAQPLSGANAFFNTNHELVVDYSGLSFAGTDQLTIKVCDASGACVNQIITIEVAGQVTIFNAVSPNGDGKNEILFLEFIDALPQTKENKVTLFDRWGSIVYETTNYDNVTNVFKGIGNDGSELPPGTYYYSIEFSSGAPKRTGFISLRK